MPYSLRPFREEEAPRLCEIFGEAVQVIGRHGYSDDQVRVWHGRTPADPQRMLYRHSQGHRIIVAADEADIAVAYALLEPDGHLDHLYCHPDHTRRGLADRLLAEAEDQARKLGAERLYTEASELARAAFERAGYSVTHRRDFEIDGVAIHNFAMEKALI
ncbi:MAG: GNAT family N-acetyltransferase [Sphingomonadales bacterium]|nr:MAG: GNAT family N-acetyltransferase [Sphingomonadales bacterium]